jgi:hypothetical protein
LLDRLPDDCTLEDLQYHLYVVEKIHKGLDRAKSEGTIPQEEIEKRFSKWTSR